jgi:hypothetical protein
MFYIYLDESGDLGFAEKSSRFFILAGVRINDKLHNQFKRIPKNIRQQILNKKLRLISELKF